MPNLKHVFESESETSTRLLGKNIYLRKVGPTTPAGAAQNSGLHPECLAKRLHSAMRHQMYHWPLQDTN